MKRMILIIINISDGHDHDNSFLNNLLHLSKVGVSMWRRRWTACSSERQSNLGTVTNHGGCWHQHQHLDWHHDHQSNPARWLPAKARHSWFSWGEYSRFSSITSSQYLSMVMTFHNLMISLLLWRSEWTHHYQEAERRGFNYEELSLVLSAPNWLLSSLEKAARCPSRTAPHQSAGGIFHFKDHFRQKCHFHFLIHWGLLKPPLKRISKNSYFLLKMFLE